MSFRPLPKPAAAPASSDHVPILTSIDRVGLFPGLTLMRVGRVTTIAFLVDAAVIRFFEDAFLDLLVATLCVGYVTMVLFTMAGNLRIVQRGAFPREAAQIIAVIVGSLAGTILTVLIKERPLDTMFAERLAGFVATCGMGIGFGTPAHVGAAAAACARPAARPCSGSRRVSAARWA